MDRAPVEVLSRIFNGLDEPSRVSATLTCQRWLSLLSPNLPELDHLHVNLDSMACNGKISYRTSCDTSTAICQCEEHAVDQGVFLKEIFQLFGNQLRSVIVEDSLYSKNNDVTVRDYPIHVILRECGGSQLTSLEFNSLDMCSIKVWTLAVLARFSSLTAVRFSQCRFPVGMNESLLLRMLSPSFGSLEQLQMTGNDMVTDKMCLTVAKKCPRLRELDVSGCKGVTALSVIGFCESLSSNPKANPVTLNLKGTSFSSMELSRHLHNPLLKCGPCWRAQAITVNIGFDRRAIVLENKERKDLVILIYV